MARVSIGPPRLPPEGRESGRALPNFILALVFLAMGLLILATAVTVYAIFTDSDSVTPNDFASDTLDPATAITAAGSDTSIQLDWTATADTSYATGYKVNRSTTAGGPYTEIASVTPSTTVTYTDTTVTTGNTYYYVLDTYYQNWLSGNSTEASAKASSPVGTGFLSPLAEAFDTGGDGDGFELNPTNAFADDAAFASNVNGSADRHRFYNYGFSIPGGSTINGIEVRLDWWLDSVSGANRMDVELSWDGGTTWTAAKADTQETTTEHTVTLGGSADTWGRTWSDTEFTNANFRVRMTSLGSGSRDFFLDWVPVQVTYTP